MNSMRVHGTGPVRPNVHRRFVMDHKQFEAEVPTFLDDRLSNEELADFLEHYDECAACRDELSIQYLVRAGLPKLETGETFHLQKELDSCLRAARERLHRRKRLRSSAYILEVITLLSCMAAIVITAVFI